MAILASPAWAQDSVVDRKSNSIPNKKNNPSKSNNKYISPERNVDNFKNVEDAIQNNNDDQKYNEYIVIADKLSADKKYQEANNYLNQALVYFSKQKNKKKQSEIHRKIALNNERLSDDKNALDHYQKAQEKSLDIESSSIIQRDIDRVENANSPSSKELIIEQQIQSLDKSRDKDLLNTSYKQLADVALQNNDTSKAINALIESSKTTINSDDKIDLQDKLADIYASSDSLPKAIQVTHEARTIALQQYDWTNYVNQSLKLSDYYLQSKLSDSAEYILKVTLGEAYKQNNTQAILLLVNALRNYYQLTGDVNRSDQYVDTLLDRLWEIALVDTNIYQDALYNEVTSRIELLEKDKENQKVLYERTQLFNTILITVSGVLLVAILLIIFSLKKLKRKNYLIQLQSLRKEMNPHFIFNALNSVNLFIAENDEISANKYLTNYSSLMRNVLTTSNKNFISFQEEIVSLKHYIALEHMRFEDYFDYSIIIDESLQDSSSWVPNMIIQPFIENAIWHGLRYKPTKGHLLVKWSLLNDKIQVAVEDDGIGYDNSQKLKSKNQKTHDSIGIANTVERMKILNTLFGTDIMYRTESVNVSDHSGHRVIITWSINIVHHEA